MPSQKIITYIYYGIVLVLAIIGFVAIWGAAEDQVPKVSFALWQSVIYTAIAAVVGIGASVYLIAKDIKSSIGDIIGAAVLVLAFFLIKGGAGKLEMPQKMMDNGVTAFEMTAAHAGLWISFVLIIGAMVIAIVSGVKSAME